MKKLKENINSLEEQLKKIQADNEKAENGMITDFKRAEAALSEKLQDYDKDMDEKTEALNKINDNYGKVTEELNIVQSLYDGMLEEKRRKEEEEEAI